MLCEKCGRRQAEWGNLCNECEKGQAGTERKQEIVRAVNRLKWFALWMAGDFVMLGVIVAFFWGLSHGPQIPLIVILLLLLVVVAVCLREWWLWRGYAARLNNGEFQPVANELLHHPKGFWKYAEHHYATRRRRQAGIAGTYVYFWELEEFCAERRSLEALSKTEQ